MEVGKLNLALPALASSIGAGAAAQQLVVSGYALGFALALIPAGRVGDLWSRRGVLAVGLAGFGLASLAAGLASGPAMLVVCRVLQGICAGLLLPQTSGILQDLWSGASLAKAWGGFGAVVGVSAMVAPPLGGLLLGILGDDWGWRVNLLSNVPVVVLLAGLLPRIPPNATRSTARSIDWAGLALIALGIGGLMLPFAGVLPGGVLGGPGVALLLVGAGAIVGFWRWERRLERAGGDPLVAPRLWRRMSFASGMGVGGLFFVAMAGVSLVPPLFLQTQVGLSPWHVALLVLGSSAASAVSAWVGGTWSARLGRSVVAAGLWIVAGAVVLTAGACLLADRDPGLVWLVVPAQVLLGFGSGLITAPNQALSMQDVPREDGSVAGSVFQVAQRVGTAVGVTAGLSLFYALASPARGLIASSALAVLLLLAAVGLCWTERRAT